MYTRSQAAAASAVAAAAEQRTTPDALAASLFWFQPRAMRARRVDSAQPRAAGLWSAAFPFSPSHHLILPPPGGPLFPLTIFVCEVDGLSTVPTHPSQNEQMEKWREIKSLIAVTKLQVQTDISGSKIMYKILRKSF